MITNENITTFSYFTKSCTIDTLQSTMSYSNALDICQTPLFTKVFLQFLVRFSTMRFVFRHINLDRGNMSWRGNGIHYPFYTDGSLGHAGSIARFCSPNLVFVFLFWLTWKMQPCFMCSITVCQRLCDDLAQCMQAIFYSSVSKICKSICHRFENGMSCS